MTEPPKITLDVAELVEQLRSSVPGLAIEDGVVIGEAVELVVLNRGRVIVNAKLRLRGRQSEPAAAGSAQEMSHVSTK